MALLSRSKLSRLLLLTLFLASAPLALAINTWYVDGVNGNDSNDCMSAKTACGTIKHAIALAHWNDVILVAPATYFEYRINITKSLKIIGSDAASTVINGGFATGYFILRIPEANTRVFLSKLTVRGGSNSATGHRGGGGITNYGLLTIDHCLITDNRGESTCLYPKECTSEDFLGAAGIYTSGSLTVNYSTISDNISNSTHAGGIGVAGGTTVVNNSILSGNRTSRGGGGGIYVGDGTITVNRSTVSGGTAGFGGGVVVSSGNMVMNNSTLSNSRGQNGGAGGAVVSVGATLTINNSTISNNGWGNGWVGGIYNAGSVTLQNSIVANSPGDLNCYGPMISNGYNLSSDNSCNFNGPGDMNNTDPKLGTLGNYGGPTQTVPIQQGSPAIDAGNSNGCTDSNGNLLKTDQRGFIRPDHEQSVGCDIGAFERQKNK